MTQIMTPSDVQGITAGQIGKMGDNLAARCRKNKRSLPSNIVQDVLHEEGDELAEEQFVAFRTRVERRAEMIVRHFKVDRTKTREEMIAALGRKEYVNADILATMPTDGPEEGDLYFFPLKRYVPLAEIAGEFESRVLVPDYFAQMQVNIDDPAFADEHPNGMQWDKNSFASFRRWNDGRGVYVNRNDNFWHVCWWFGGRRKYLQKVS